MNDRPPDLLEVLRAVRAFTQALYPDNQGVYLVVRHHGRKPTRILVPAPPPKKGRTA